MKDVRERSRDAAPEAYRVALMFGICLLHSVSQGQHGTPWLQNILLSCVNGFVFISGYYGLVFRPSKLVRLYAIGLFCWALATLLAFLFLPHEIGLGSFYLASYKGFMRGCWFLHAYALLMFLAPLVDAALEALPTSKCLQAMVPLMVLLFGWNFATQSPIIQDYVPYTEGLGSYTALALLAVYVAARLFRRFNVGQWLTWKRLVILLPVLWAITGLGLGDYASPFATTLAAAMFVVFMRIPWSLWIQKMVLWIGPSMFAIYLLHTSTVGFRWIAPAEQFLVETHGWPLLLAYGVVALSLFLSCLLLDLPRRLLTWATHRLWQPILQRLDAAYDALLSRLSRAL